MIDVLRDVFAKEPSAEGWGRVCEAVGVGAVEGYALEYAQEHLGRWPDALREAPTRWNEALLAGARVEGWSLARVALFEQAKAGDAAKLLKMPQMAQMTGLRFHRGALGPKAGIKALVGSPHLGQVRSLALEGCLIGDEGAAEIFGSALGARCEALRFEAGVTYNPRSLLSTVASLEALSRATGMVALRSLSVEGSFLWAGEEAARALSEGPRLSAEVRAVYARKYLQTLKKSGKT